MPKVTLLKSGRTRTETQVTQEGRERLGGHAASLIEAGPPGDMEPPPFNLGLGDGASLPVPYPPHLPNGKLKIIPALPTDWSRRPRVQAQECQLQQLVLCPPAVCLIPQNRQFTNPALPLAGPPIPPHGPHFACEEGEGGPFSAPLYSTRRNQDPESNVRGPSSHREQIQGRDRTRVHLQAGLCWVVWGLDNHRSPYRIA